jgi:hypothetical protein
MKIFEIMKQLVSMVLQLEFFDQKLNQFVMCFCFVKDKASLGTLMATM